MYLGLSFLSVNKLNYLSSGADFFFVSKEILNQKQIKRIHQTKKKVYGVIHYFSQGECPQDSKVQKRITTDIEEAITNYQIDGLWLDGVRFGVDWPQGEKGLSTIHYCQKCDETWKKSKVNDQARWKCQFIYDWVLKAKEMRDKQNSRLPLGIFAVPWKKDRYNGAILTLLGQDITMLADLVDVFTPMIYHRMIGEPVSYIHEIVKYTHDLTDKLVLPILQVKDMPDWLDDKLTDEELKLATKEAFKPPSSGVSFFTWDQAEKTSKDRVITLLFRKS